MTLDELKEKLYHHNVPERWYSLDDGLKDDAVVIYHNYGKWECYYYERGVRSHEQEYTSAEDAYDYLWRMMESELRTFNIPPRTV